MLKALARRMALIALDPDYPPMPVAGGTFNEFGFDHLPVKLVAHEPAKAGA